MSRWDYLTFVIVMVLFALGMGVLTASLVFLIGTTFR